MDSLPRVMVYNRERPQKTASIILACIAQVFTFVLVGVVDWYTSENVTMGANIKITVETCFVRPSDCKYRPNNSK